MRISRSIAVTVLLATAGLAAGCGDDGSDGAEDSPSPSVVTETVTAPTSSATAPESSATETPTTPTSTTTLPEETATDPESTDGGDTGDGEVDLTQPPTSYADAVAHVEAAGIDGSENESKRFSTPGDAVYCVLQHRFIDPSCELLTGAIRDREVCRNAPSKVVGRVVITPRGAEPECNTDTIREPGAPTVDPQGTVTAGSVTCAVETIGVTCIDTAAETGFFITAGAYAVF